MGITEGSRKGKHWTIDSEIRLRQIRKANLIGKFLWGQEAIRSRFGFRVATRR